jgi:uncharacterized membrane protein YcaP (DUF421 family)
MDALPSPPRIQRRVRVTPEQLIGLGLLASTIVAGTVREPERVIEVIPRIAAIYLFLMVAFRLLGKRELSVMSPLELITLMIIPEIASGTLSGEGPLLQALAGISALLMMVFFVSALAARFQSIERLTESQPRVLVENGRLCEDALSKERITTDELFAEMHKHGISELSQLSWAVLESSGDIAFVPRGGRAAVEASDHPRVA